VRFENDAKALLVADDEKPRVRYESFGSEALLSIPMPDHYLPPLYVIGTRQAG
jgi:4,5-DOPA dioxygenase extradiol